jgi:hypothetical protein
MKTPYSKEVDDESSSSNDGLDSDGNNWIVVGSRSAELSTNHAATGAAE